MHCSTITAAALCASLMLPASATAAGFTWKDHARPFDFLFGNHIDTHQETTLQNDGSLRGSFYVVQLDQDGGGFLDITDEGDPIMRHCTMPEHYPDCQAGWVLTAVPCIPEVNGCSAMFLYHQHDHPVWLIGPRKRQMDGEMFLGGSRDQIPQPGFGTHFHWLTDPGGVNEAETVFLSSVPELEALFDTEIDVAPECNVVEASQLTPGTICPGYFLALQVLAMSSVYRENPGPQWAFHHGGENILLQPGIDIASHTNIVTSYVADPTIGLGNLPQ